jgi:dipeptidyl-peptidase-4
MLRPIRSYFHVLETHVKSIRRSTFVLVALLAATPALARQSAEAPRSEPLSLDTIFAYTPKSIGQVQWLPDGSGYIKLEPAASTKALELVRYDAATGAKTVLVPAAKLVPAGASEPLGVDEFWLSDDGRKLLVFTNTKRVWRSNSRGDYWLLDTASGALRKLGGDAKPSTLMFAKLSPDQTRVGYVRENNLYVENLADGRITQLTSDGTAHRVNGTFDWVYEEELFCRDGWRWSPDGTRIAFWQLDSEGVKEFVLVDNTSDLYPRLTTFPYPKAGERNSAARVGVVGASGGATTWLAVPGDPREHYIARMDWAASSDEVVLQQLNRRQNANLVMLGDARTGAVRTILAERDDAWVDVSFGDFGWGSDSLAAGHIKWLEGGRRFLWASERDGWRHIYSVSRDGTDVKCVTPGDYDVIGVDRIDEAGGWLYVAASPDNATQRYLYRVRLSGGAPERLSPSDQPGTHRYRIAPRGDMAIHTYSSLSKVPVVGIVRLPGHERVRTLVDNEELKKRLEGVRLSSREFFRVDVGDGVALDGWIMKPPGFDPLKRYPVLFFAYGEPWSQTVLDVYDSSMWHELLAQKGYLVISVDNRGTPAPRGRAWRKSIYRRLGVLNAQDQANAARAIAKWPFVDATRMAIWGWSGGGSTSLNAILRYPDVYRVAMSVAPVPDIRYYDTIYQERYSGLPQDHPDEYKQSSPITFAGQLKGDLLVVHGTGDDNVHYQGTEALVNALVAANKPFTMMAYPNRTHGISEGPGTTRHLFGLLTRFLEEKLPPGPRGTDAR